MGVYRPEGNYRFFDILPFHLDGTTAVGYTDVGGDVHVAADPSNVRMTFVLKGSTLDLGANNALTGTIEEIEVWIRDFEFFAGRITGASLDASVTKTAFDTLETGDLDPIYNLIVSQITSVVGDDGDQRYEHSLDYPAMDIDLGVGQDLYIHDTYPFNTPIGGPSLTINGGLGPELDSFSADGFRIAGVEIRPGDNYFRDSDGVVHTLIGFEAHQGTRGPDTFIGDDSAINRFYGGQGNDEVHGGGLDDWIRSGVGADTVYGYAGNDLIQIQGTYNYIDGGPGNDTLDLNISVDSPHLIDLNVDVQSSADDGTRLISIENINGGDNFDTLIGDDGGNNLIGNGRRDVLEGRGGKDFLQGGTDDDLLDGGDGDDTLFGGGPGNTEQDFGIGDDTLLGGRGSDLLYGEEGDDTLEGGDGFDLLNGGTDDDLLRGGNGNDRLLGNLGNDTLEGDAGNDTLFGGPSGNDELHGGDNDDQLFGEAGKDFLAGDDGNDTLNGGTNDDTLLGGNGDDSLLGGAGNDELFGGPTGADTLDGGQGSDFLFAESADDLLIGGDGFDLMNGGAGDDSMLGGNGGDRLEGNLGEDTLDGGSGDDELFGGNGAFADTLIGGTGNDTLFGEQGADTFVFADGFGTDEIRDFQLNGGDVIDLAAVSAITSFTDLQNNHLSQDGADAVITAGANSIRLTGIDENDLTAGDFDFLV